MWCNAMRSTRAKIVLSIFSTLFLLLVIQVGDLFAGHKKDFKNAVRLIKKIPYNPRPIDTDSADVTGISEDTSRDNFLAAFTRFTFSAPANGRTFDAGTDITLVGYRAIQLDPPERPWIILMHGGFGDTSIATQSQFLIHLANVLFANGYNVLAFDRRDGLISRCAYKEGSLDPDPSRSQANFVGLDPILFCDRLPLAFRDPDFEPNSLPTGFGAFASGDILAAAQYLKDVHGAQKIGVLTGSAGGISLFRAASIQDDPANDFDAGLLDVLLVFSPVADDNTIRFTRPDPSPSCFRISAAEVYSGFPGSGIGDFVADPVGAVEDLFGLLNGIKNIEGVTIPVLIIHTMTDNILFIEGALAYQAKTRKMKLGKTIIMTRLGHYQDMWQSDPFWADKVVLTYFKRLLAKDIPSIGDGPGFSSLGPNTKNPLIVKLRFRRKDADRFVVQESVVSFFDASLIPGLPGFCDIVP